LSRAALDHLVMQNHRTIIWNNVPGDWRDPHSWVERCVALASREPWSVVVLHDIEGGCVARLPELLDRLEDLGVTFEQKFPDSVTLTRGGKIVNLPRDYIAD
jgi:peptidoglycan-N-acetylglucosamine deacetylase